jgi:hypothetical protein
VNNRLATLIPETPGTLSWYRILRFLILCFLGPVGWLVVKLFCHVLQWICLVVRSLSKVLLKMLSVFELT